MWDASAFSYRSDTTKGGPVGVGADGSVSLRNKSSNKKKKKIGALSGLTSP